MLLSQVFPVSAFKIVCFFFIFNFITTLGSFLKTMLPIIACFVVYWLNPKFFWIIWNLPLKKFLPCLTSTILSLYSISVLSKTRTFVFLFYHRFSKHKQNKFYKKTFFHFFWLNLFEWFLEFCPFFTYSTLLQIPKTSFDFFVHVFVKIGLE